MMQSSGLVPPTLRPPAGLGEAYLRLSLADTVPALLRMKQVQEVLVLPAARLTPIPNLPPLVLGLMNRRSRVLWVVDLPQLLGLPPLDAGRQSHALAIIQVASGSLALAVHQVDGMGWLSEDEIQPPPPHLPSHLMPFLRGCVLQAQHIALVLDPEAIVHAPALLNH
ncbi:MAG: chemotaxis protein CheW [Leptolyngbyaceae cyanobacterium HOT.MB2.61]|nr:chemotaxis protein CheW [Leptolyngbyaceae cyanobacterium HOT.MB2.61]